MTADWPVAGLTDGMRNLMRQRYETPPKKKKKCPGSGTVQMLAWFPDEDGYPGAVVCLHCSLGIQVVRNSVHDAKSESGHEGKAGTVRVHYV